MLTLRRHVKYEWLCEYCITLYCNQSISFLKYISDSGDFATENEGNFFRFFDMLSVSADAMRIVFDKLPGEFEEKIKEFMKCCMRHRRRPVYLGKYLFYL